MSEAITIMRLRMVDEVQTFRATAPLPWWMGRKGKDRGKRED